MDKLKMVLDWFPNNIHVGFLLAQVRGYYEQENIELELLGDVHGVMEVDEGDFICGPAASMLENIAKGAELLGIGQITYIQDSGLISLKEQNIVRPRDMQGKRMTHWAPKWFHLLIDELVRRDGGDPTTIEKIQIDVGNPEEVLGNVADLIWIYKNWEYYVMKSEGKECNIIDVAQYGHPFDYPTPAIAVQKKLWKENPELVERFFNATERGYQDVVKEGTSIIPEIRHLLPDVDDEILYGGVEHLLDLFLDEEGRWGHLDEEAWTALQDYFMETKIYGTSYPVETYVKDFRN